MKINTIVRISQISDNHSFIYFVETQDEIDNLQTQIDNNYIKVEDATVKEKQFFYECIEKFDFKKLIIPTNIFEIWEKNPKLAFENMSLKRV